MAVANGDSTFGRLLLVMRNYGSADEQIRVNVFLSFTSETQFFFPVGPLSFSYMPSSLVSYSTMARQMVTIDWPQPQEIGESENPPTTLEDVIAREALREQSESRLYRGLRLEVGAIRLRYAKDSLRKKRSQSQEDLHAQCARFRDGEIVQHPDEGFMLRGVYFAGKVTYLDITPRMLSNFPSMCSGVMKVEDVNQRPWVSTRQSIDVSKFPKDGLIRGDVFFNWAKFVAGDVDGAFHNVGGPLLRTVAEALRVPSKSKLGDVLDKSKLGHELTKVAGSADQLLHECSVFLGDMRVAISNLQQSVQSGKRQVLVKLVLAMAKGCVYLWLCVHGEWDPKVVFPLVLALGLDFGSVATEIGEAYTMVMNSIVGSLGVRAQSWSLRDASSVITIGRALKDIFFFLFQTFRDWYSKTYGEVKKKMTMLDECREEIEALLQESDFLVTSNVLESEKSQCSIRIRQLVKHTRTLLGICGNHECMRDVRQALFANQVSLLRKLEGLGVCNEMAVTRFEPTVVYLYGTRGAGKSLASMCLATKICCLLGVPPKVGIYSRSMGKDFWDGYVGQPVVVIDDVGQSTDDEDWKDFCQLVSCCPYRVPMAHLGEKGRHFTSPYIICTSNNPEPSPRTVYEKEAVLRRLHLKVNVRPNVKCMRHSNQTLDVDLARAQNMIHDMSCVVMEMDGDEITMDELVRQFHNRVTKCENNMTAFMDMWAQAGDDGDVSLRVLLDSPKTGKPLPQLWASFDNSVIWTISVVLGAIGVFAALGAAVYYFRKEKEPELSPEAAYSGMPRPRRVVNLTPTEYSAQSTLEVTNLIHSNLVRLGVEVDGCIKWLVNACGVKENYMLLPAHALEEVDFDQDVLVIARAGTFYTIKANAVEIINPVPSRSDVRIMQVPGIPKFRNITEHFVDETRMLECDGLPGTLATYNGGLFQLVCEGPLKYLHSASYGTVRDGKHVDIHIDGAWKGAGETTVGSCGGILVSSNNRLQNPMIGMHVAAGGGTLISAVVTRQMLNAIGGKVVANSGRIRNVRFVDPPMNLDCRTEYGPTPFHGHLPSPKRPSAKPNRKQFDVDPVYWALAKYAVDIVEEPMGFDDVVSSLEAHLFSIVGDSVRGALSPSEAIRGIPGLEPLNMSSSPGWPYVLRGLSKRDLIVDDVMVHPMLCNLHSDCVDNIITGVPPDVRYITQFKDELRPVEKVLLGKTRVVEGCNLDFVIVCRQLFGRLVAALHNNLGFNTSMAIGIDPDRDWHMMIWELMCYGKKVLTLDFSNFDATISPFMLRNVLRIMCRLAGYDDKLPTVTKERGPI
nr:MAG: RNA-dependent RNA polymerase [Riboviria sp.]